MNKQLRALGDVDLSQGTPDFTIEVIALEDTNADGSASGMLSVGVNLLARMNGLDEVLKSGDKCLPASEKHRLSVLRTSDSRIQLLVFSTPTSQLERLASEIVSSFDVRCLEPARK
jgi:hypothetical protein